MKHWMDYQMTEWLKKIKEWLVNEWIVNKRINEKNDGIDREKNQ